MNLQFLRAFNRFNRFFPSGRRVSSSSIPIQIPDPKPGPVGFDFVKAAIKWENFPTVVVVLGFLTGACFWEENRLHMDGVES